MRRTNERIRQEREIAWINLKGDGVNLYTLCLACGTIKHCRGKVRETVRCESCFTDGPNGARLIYTVIHTLRTEEEPCST